MPDNKFTVDVLVIGGGITGAGIYRELALNGVKCLLVDKKDFASQTSSKSSKMLHGGIRYLETYDFDLVSEALHEKNFWLKTAPHLCYESEFFFPVYKDSPHPFWMVRLGLLTYDILSGFENKNHRKAKMKELEEKIPGIKKDGLTGCGVYHDAIVDDLKMNLEVIYDANKKRNAQALSYFEVTEIFQDKKKTKVYGKDLLSNKPFEVTCKEIVVACGPFTDQFMNRAYKGKWNNCLLPSKGSHIWLSREKLPLQSPVVITDAKGRIIFIIPQGDQILVGTTESVHNSFDYFDMEAGEEDCQYLIDNLKNYFPGLAISNKDILASFAGIRPLVLENREKDSHKTARTHKIIRPNHNIHVMVGGKYTTFRSMAQDLTGPLMHKLNAIYDPILGRFPLSQKSQIRSFAKNQHITPALIIKIIENESVRTIDDVVLRRMGQAVCNYWPDRPCMHEFWQQVYNKSKESIIWESKNFDLSFLNK